MNSSTQAAKSRMREWAQRWTAILREREEQVFLALTLVIGALVGATVVAFILLTERFGARLYPAGGMGLRRLLVPIVGSHSRYGVRKVLLHFGDTGERNSSRARRAGGAGGPGLHRCWADGWGSGKKK